MLVTDLITKQYRAATSPSDRIVRLGKRVTNAVVNCASRE